MKRVLWIDDDYKLLHALGKELARSGIEVQFAEDISTAIDAVLAAPFDLIIVDANLRLGHLESRFPAISALIPSDTSGGGIYLARFLTNGSDSIPASARVVICSSFDKTHVDDMAPGVGQSLPYLSKSDAFVDPAGFREQIRRIIEEGHVPEPVGPSPKAPESGVAAPGRLESEHYFEELYHDVRNGIAQNIPVLTALNKRLESLVSNRSTSTVELCRSFERAADQVLEELTDVRLGNWDKWEAAEAIRQRLANDLEAFSISKLSMIGDLVRHLGAKLAELPKTAGHGALVRCQLDYNLHICRMEVSSVIENIGATLTESTPSRLRSSDNGFDSSDLIRNLIMMEELSALHRGIEFQPTIEDDLVIAHGHRSSYRRLMASILENAVKYSGRMRGENAWIKVKHYRSREAVVTEIESWGPPVLAGEKEAVFERGARGQRANRSGSGLGLAIARQEAAALGGKVSIRSNAKGRQGQRYVQTTTVVEIPINAA